MKKILTALSYFLMLGFAQAQAYQPFPPLGGLPINTSIGRISQTIQEIKLLANKALPATNGIRTGGSDTGTDISAAYADIIKTPLSSYLKPTQSRPRYIFFGGADNFQLIANISPTLINSGKVALYEHANGVAPLTAAYRQSIQSTFAPTGSQLVAGGGNAMGEISLTTDPQYLGYFNGKYPIEDNTDIFGTGTFTEPDGTVLNSFYTADELATFKAGVDSIIPYGAKNIAPVVTPNSFDENSIGTDFATDGYWANTRAAALYGGAIAIDTPPSYAMWQGKKYIATVVSEIKWGLANHLRVTVLVSPFNITGASPDPEVWNSTASYIDLLIRNNAIPTSYVVLTYCGCTNTNPLTGSTDLSGSMDHIVQMLLSAPVSPPGTAVPQSPVLGTVSEAYAFSPKNISHTVGSMNTSPTYIQKLADINPPNSGANIIGSLGLQSASDVLIQSGKIGTPLYSNSVLDIFLSTSSSFLTLAPLTFQGIKGNQVVSGGTNSALLNINDPYSTDPTQTGISLGSATTAPYLSLDATGNNLMIGNGSIFIQGNTFDYKNSGLKNGQNGYVQTWNQGINGEIDLIDYHGTGAGGMTWYNYDATSNSLVTLMSLNASTLSVSGNIIAGGVIQLSNKSKSDILDISSPVEGQILNDSTDHVPVVYENGHWYPIQLGSALQ